MSAKLIAYYLPQYHPTPENDEWWGKGFTEWTNVTKAKQLYKGHEQPKFPADLGYYDLRVAEVRKAQADMAKEYGLSGFCYYHYWFGNGVQTLNRPIEEVIESGEPDFPFCFCWANQSWTGHWFGAEKKMLIEQTYPGDEDIEMHFNCLLKAFNDKRYIRIDDKPLLKILDIRDLPDPGYMTKKLRELAIKNGLKGLYIIAGNLTPEAWDPAADGFDAVTDNSFNRPLRNAFHKKNTFLNRLLINKITRRVVGKKLFFKYRNTISMKQFTDQYEIASGKVPVCPIVLPNWDNTPRSLSKGTVIRDCDPKYFGEQLKIAQRHLQTSGAPVIFIKSWNEWAEGNFLEPDSEYKFGYLEELKRFCADRETNAAV